MRARLRKLFNTKAVPHEPALRFEGDWQSEVAEQICRHWVESQRTHNAQTVSIIDLSRMKALDYERKHRDSIPAGLRLLDGNPGTKDYYEAQMTAFLNAIGLSGDDLSELMESFKLTGTGGLHRQHVTLLATAGGLLGATGQFVAAQHPAAAAAFYGARLLMQVFIAERTLDSGRRRMRNAGTEDVLPDGRADAAPTAKHAPTTFEASHDVIWSLNGVQKNLRKMETAMRAVEAASAAYEASATDTNLEHLENTRKDLEVAFARICYQIEVKASYKASSESAKIEFRGNERYFATSYAGTTLTLGAGLIPILTPILGLAAGPVTGGASAAVAVLVLLLYVGYQLSPGPSKDGEAKAKRAIVALSKSIDILSGDKVASREKRADAYKAYIEDRKAARFKFGQARSEAKKAAKAKLLAQLDEISQQDKIEDGMNSKRNWVAYCQHRERVSELEKTAAREGWTSERIASETKRLKERFEDDHRADFSTQAVTDAWKKPIRARMDIARRLLKGKVAQSHKQLINLMRHPGLKARFSPSNKHRAIEEARAELRKNLRDMFNLELALQHMAPLADNAAPTPAAMRDAAIAIGAIEDVDVRNTFCGDGKAQVKAATRSKKLSAGEAERYVYINAGASALGIGLNTAVAATDFSIITAKADKAVHVGLYNPNPEGKPRIPAYNDYKFAAISQTGAPLTAHMNAGDRTAFQKTQMPRVLQPTTRAEDERAELAMSFGHDTVHLDEGNDEVKAKLDTLVEQLAQTDSVPDKLILSLAPQDPGTSAATGKNVAIDLQSTSNYHIAQYRNSSKKDKLKVLGAKAGVVGSHVFMSLAGLPAQGIAQINLKRTRATLERATELDQKVRETLISTMAHEASQEDDESQAATDIEVGDEEVHSIHDEENRSEDVEMDPVFDLMRRYYKNERLPFDSDEGD